MHEAFGFITIDENDLDLRYDGIAMISTEVVSPLVLISPRGSLIQASFQNHELLPPVGEHAEET